MNQINLLRRKIRGIDKKIINLIFNRLNIVMDIALLKLKYKMNIVNFQQEKKVIKRAMKYGRKKNINQIYIKSIFKLLVQLSCEEQKKKIKFIAERDK